MGYYRRRRRRRRTGMIVSVLLLACLLVSCVAGSNALWVQSLFGADVNVYLSEPTLESHSPESALSLELRNALEVLLADSAEIPEFKTAAKACRLYRDNLLALLLRQGYSSYVGNPELSGRVAKSYPYLSASHLIPASDLENAAARYFGASSVANGDGDCFTYLKKSDCYTTPGQTRAVTVHMEITEILETERTYRVTFTLTDSEGACISYTALLIKRAEKAPYIKALTKI
jgi:hypothetical protein